MKKLVSIIVFSVFALTVSAQINVATNGNVGIKTTTPATEFSVNGAVTISALSTPTNGSAIRTTVANQNACAYHLWNNYYNQDVFYVHGTGYLWCKLGGYFGSDINMKEDIRDIASPLNKVMNLRGVNYKFKDSETDGKEKQERMGLIAQEVEKVIPEVVKVMNDGTKAIAYTDLIGVLVEAIKEQQKQIEEQQKQVETLQKQIANLTPKTDKQ